MYCLTFSGNLGNALMQSCFLTYIFWRPCHTFPGRLHGLGFSSLQIKFCVQADIFFVCTSHVGCEVPECLLWMICVACVPDPRPVRAPRQLCVRYGQHMCTASYRSVNCMIYVRELCVRCEGTCTYIQGWIYALAATWQICTCTALPSVSC